jgi:deoxyribose-phosphate aldolase
LNSLNSVIDHTLLKPDATQKDVERICAEAKEYIFRGVCVNPIWVEFISVLLKDTDIKTVSVCDFPLGSSLIEIRKEEAKKAIDSGADEVDVVMNLGKFLDKKYDEVLSDLKEIVNIVHPECSIKVIIEAPLLSDDNIKKAAELVTKSGADIIKTGTGTKGGVTIHQVEVIKSVTNLPIKASGGIRDKEFALSLVKSGASILGTSSGVQIVT